jgi:glycosyltransferase involved in cell wall biosynthesis
MSDPWMQEYHGEPDPEELAKSGLDEIQAKGVSAELPQGIVYQAPWRKDGDGMARHACANVMALARAGAAVRLDSLGTAGRSFFTEELDKETQQLVYLTHPQFKKVVLCVKHAIFGGYEHLNLLLTPRSSSFAPPDEVSSLLSRTVLYTSWERDTLESLAAQALNQLAQVWVPCHDNLEAFARGGVSRDKLRIVPYCWGPDDPTAAIPLPRGREDVPEGKRFYYIGKWEPRKNQHMLLGAFLRAYRAKDKASLFIKTSVFGRWTNYPLPQESIEHWLAHPDVIANGWTTSTLKKKVRIVSEMVSREDIIEIHRKNNIYVSAAHAEAWDIPAFEARLAGNRMVYTDWGGPRDYANAKDIPIKWDYAPVDLDYGWHGYMWPTFQTEDLIAALKLAAPPERRVFDSQLTYFGQHQVGEVMVRHLSEVLGPLAPGYG